MRPWLLVVRVSRQAYTTFDCCLGVAGGCYVHRTHVDTLYLLHFRFKDNHQPGEQADQRATWTEAKGPDGEWVTESTSHRARRRLVPLPGRVAEL